MRKALALLLAVAVAAVVAGRVIPSSAVIAGASTLSTSQLDAELQAISSSPSFSCYLDARDFLQSSGTQGAPALRGVSSQTWSTGAVVEWGNIRTTQLILDDRIAVLDPAAFSVGALDEARSSLATAITETLSTATDDAESAGTSFSCKGEATGPATLVSLPSWFLTEQVRAQAATLGLATLVPNPIPTSGARLQAWYAKHSGEFDTTCLSDLIVATQATADEVEAQVNYGLNFATAVSRYSTDAAGRKKHGAIGCFSPTSPDWSSVEQYVGTIATRSATVVQGEGGWYVISPTSRTPNSFRSILTAVESEARDLNVQSAQVLATSFQAAAHVSVDPAIGAWVATSLGGTITAPSAPPSDAILNAPANTPAT
jgi:hypothetical protein